MREGVINRRVIVLALLATLMIWLAAWGGAEG
jgi:hypothetical protein